MQIQIDSGKRSAAAAAQLAYHTGAIPDRDGAMRPILDFAIPEPCGKLLQRAALAALQQDNKLPAVNGPAIIEIGFASGLATLRLAAAAQNAECTWPGVIRTADPADHLNGAGELLLQRAGVAELVDLRRIYSHQMLAELEREGARVRFAFVDGAHLFDTVLTDCFLLDKILDVGGILALHDLWMPAIQSVALFLTTNRAYQPVTIAPSGSLHAQACGSEKRGVDPARAVSPRFVEELLPYVDWHTLLLRKTKEEDRPWDHFTPCWD